MLNIARQRLDNQGLARTKFQTPEEVVAWLGAVQSQDYAGAKWALAQRVPGMTDAALDQLFNAGAILRTHVMRPTWHFVLPADIRWLLELTAPRVKAVSAYYFRQAELDEVVFARSNAILAQALQGGQQLTRPELGAILAQHGINTADLRLTHLMMAAELDGVICSGGRRGKQFTYALLAERAPQAQTLPREAALAELTRRYFTSHGPALVEDFAWWSGLTITECKVGIELVRSQLQQETIDGQRYWFGEIAPAAEAAPLIHLLPNYDEYTVAYKDRSAIFDDVQYADKMDARQTHVLSHTIVSAGEVIGTWQRTFSKGIASIQTMPFRPFTTAETDALAAAAARYSAFLEMPVVLT